MLCEINIPKTRSLAMLCEILLIHFVQILNCLHCRFAHENVQQKIGKVCWSARFGEIIHLCRIFAFGGKNVCRFQACYAFVLVVAWSVVGQTDVCNRNATIIVVLNFIFYKHFAVFHEEWCFNYVAEYSRCRILFQDTAFDAVVNPFCMVLGIAEYVYALVYRLVD